jgi:Zn-dependent protease
MFALFNILVLVFSVIVHEVAHGAMADYLGDKTAKEMGRLSVNPLRHIDLFGSILVPLFLILSKSHILVGWAKPVPVNPYALRDKKYGQAKVALAGPLANITIAVFFGLLLRFVPWHSSLFWQNIAIIFQYIVWINLVLAIFNLVPIPPLDGSHILFAFLPFSAQSLKIFLTQFGIFFLFLFILFVFPYFDGLLIKIFHLLTGIKII